MDDLKRTLLIVDDDDDIREILTDCAERDGYAVFIAQDGVEALELLRTKKIDAVLTDLMMPNMDGKQLILKTRSMGKSTPFVLISGVANEESILSAFRSGACDFIAKPFATELLRTIVTRVLDIGARLNQIDILLAEIVTTNGDLAPKVDNIRRHQQQISRLLTISAR